MGAGEAPGTRDKVSRTMAQGEKTGHIQINNYITGAGSHLLLLFLGRRVTIRARREAKMNPMT